MRVVYARRVRWVVVIPFVVGLGVGPSAYADEDDDSTPAAPAPTTPAPKTPATITVSATPADGARPANADQPQGPPPEAPPARPWQKGIVVEGSAGVLAYLGAFRRLAPPAFFQRVQAGYELFNWLMVFGGGELAFTDTSVGQDASKVRAFPIWGFDAGARLTVRPLDRLGVFVQGDVGLMKADVPANTLTIVGFPKTESLRPFLGGRLGLEWYQVDRHLAFGLAGGPRYATGFARAYGKGDSPLMWDAAVTLRYTF